MRPGRAPDGSAPVSTSGDNLDPAPQFLSIPNWEKYQPKLKNGKPNREWIRLQTHTQDDPRFASLTMFERAVLIGIWQYKGRTGNNIPNDPKYISRALYVIPKESHCIPRSIRKMTLLGFLVLCNQQNEVESAPRDETRRDKTIQPPKVPRTPTPRPAFVPPSLEQVAERMEEVGIEEPWKQAEAFMGHYESNGWMVGKNKMKSWRGAIQTWKHSPYRNGGNGNGNGKLYGQARSDANRAAFAEALRRAEERDAQATLRTQ